MNLPLTGSRGSGHRWSGQIAPQHGWERPVHFCGSKERAMGHLARTDGQLEAGQHLAKGGIICPLPSYSGPQVPQLVTKHSVRLNSLWQIHQALDRQWGSE